MLTWMRRVASTNFGLSAFTSSNDGNTIASFSRNAAGVRSASRTPAALRLNESDSCAPSTYATPRRSRRSFTVLPAARRRAISTMACSPMP